MWKLPGFFPLSHMALARSNCHFTQLCWTTPAWSGGSSRTVGWHIVSHRTPPLHPESHGRPSWTQLEPSPDFCPIARLLWFCHTCTTCRSHSFGSDHLRNVMQPWGPKLPSWTSKHFMCLGSKYPTKLWVLPSTIWLLRHFCLFYHVIPHILLLIPLSNKDFYHQNYGV